MSEDHDRRAHCATHENMTKAIGQHSGQWKLLLWILGIGVAAMVTLAGTAYWNQQESINLIADSVHSIDKVMTSYVSSHTAESVDGFRRITNLEKELSDLDTRVYELEILRLQHED